MSKKCADTDTISKKKVKKWRKIAIMLGVAFVAALLLEIIQINTWPLPTAQVMTEEKKQMETTFDLDSGLAMTGYEKTEAGIVTVAPDPQMYLQTWDLGYYSNISFYFSAKTENELRIQIFYPKDGIYSEANSVAASIPIGTEYYNMTIPKDAYAILRIDIDGDIIPLASIGIGKDVYYENVVLPPKIHIFRVVIVAVLLFMAIFWLSWCKVWTRTADQFKRIIFEIRERGTTRSILSFAAFPVGTGLSIFLFWVFCTVFSGIPMTAPRMIFAGFVGLFGTCLFVFRKTLKMQPEYFFLVLVISLGFLYSYYVPHSGLNSWDEDFHYTQALKTSYIDSIIMTPQDEATVVRTAPQSYDLNGGIQEIHDKQDALYHSSATERATIVNIKGIPEFFNGLGLFVGRVLGLRYYMILVLGRLFGVITYAVVGFFAIRKLKSGKMIAAIALMIPTEIFIASSYNYDSYLTCFTALGLCYYLSYWQDQNAKVSLKDAIIMIGSITFGCMTKQIYIPLLWILILLPCKKFIDRKCHLYFVISLILATGFIAFTYILPSLVTGGEIEGDVRGGSDISVGGQLSYILHNPLAYIGVMWRYLINDYFNLDKLGQMFTHMAYHGVMPNQYIYFGLTIAVTFTDKNEYDRELVHHPWAHLWPIIISLGTVVLVMTSMYLIFTPVASETINGAQFRYLIPLFLPVMLHIGSGLMENKMDRGWYNGLIYCIAAFVNFSCVYNAFICKYY